MFRQFFKFYFIFAGWSVFAAAPWDIDFQSREVLETQIDMKHMERMELAEQGFHYYIDYDEHRLNFYSTSCPYCQNQNLSLSPNLEEKLNLANFRKRKKHPENTVNQRHAHCYGVTLFFVNYLLNHPQIEHVQFLSEISNDANFIETAHNFSLNQHVNYFSEGFNEPLELNESAMIKYFQIVLEQTPSDYYVLPFSELYESKSNKAAIYVTLKNLKNKLMIVAYTATDGRGHCIAICTSPEKLLVFDSNWGLCQFFDLETLSYMVDKLFDGGYFRWLVAFPI